MTLAIWRVGPLGNAHGLVVEADGLHSVCGQWNPEEHEARVAVVADTPRCPRCAMLTRGEATFSYSNEPPVSRRVRELATKDPELTVRQLAERLETTERKVRYALEGKR